MQLGHILLIDGKDMTLAKHGSKLLGKHFYLAEDKIYGWQDSAVFFSEDGMEPSREIAQNFIKSECGICEGSSCPVGSVG